MFIENSDAYEVNAPEEFDGKEIGFSIWGPGDADSFFQDLVEILIALKAKEIYAVCFHDDGFEWFDALEKGRLKTIYVSGENGKFDHLFFEDDALSKFVSLYKRNEYIR